MPSARTSGVPGPMNFVGPQGFAEMMPLPVLCAAASPCRTSSPRWPPGAVDEHRVAHGRITAPPDVTGARFTGVAASLSSTASRSGPREGVASASFARAASASRRVPTLSASTAASGTSGSGRDCRHAADFSTTCSLLALPRGRPRERGRSPSPGPCFRLEQLPRPAYHCLPGRRRVRRTRSP